MKRFILLLAVSLTAVAQPVLASDWVVVSSPDDENITQSISADTSAGELTMTMSPSFEMGYERLVTGNSSSDNITASISELSFSCETLTSTEPGGDYVMSMTDTSSETTYYCLGSVSDFSMASDWTATIYDEDDNSEEFEFEVDMDIYMDEGLSKATCAFNDDEFYPMLGGYATQDGKVLTHVSEDDGNTYKVMVYFANDADESGDMVESDNPLLKICPEEA